MNLLLNFHNHFNLPKVLKNAFRIVSTTSLFKYKPLLPKNCILNNSKNIIRCYGEISKVFDNHVQLIDELKDKLCRN